MSVSLILHDKMREIDVVQNKRERKARRWFLKQHKFSRQILDPWYDPYPSGWSNRQ